MSAKSFTLSYDGISRVIACELFISSFNPTDVASGKLPETAKKYHGIWDTGATSSVVTQKVVDDLGLLSTGFTNCHTAGGCVRSGVYFITMFLPNRVAFPAVRVTCGEIHGLNDILIGMDIIAAGDFAITGFNRKTTFSFRVPSCERIDFVKQAPRPPIPRDIPLPPPPSKQEPRRYPKASRNQRCPCGSDKKHKDCCWDKPPV